MIRTASWLVIGVCIAGACRPPETLWIELPPDRDVASSVIWLIDYDGGQIAAAQPMPEPGEASEFPAFEWTDGPPPRFTVTAAYFVRPLIELRLPEGRLGAASAPRPCRLNEPDRIFETEVAPGSPTAWTPVSELTPAQQTFLTTGPLTCERSSRCRTFQVNVDQLEEPSGGSDFVHLDAGRALLAQEGGAFTLVTSFGVTPQPQLDGAPSLSMARAADGRLWFGGRRARVGVGPLDGPIQTSTIPNASADITALAAATDGSDVVYALEISTAPPLAGIHRFDGSTWSVLWREPVEAAERIQSQLLWLGPDDLLAVYGGRFLLRVEGRTVERIDAVANSPVGGAFVNQVARLTDADGRERFYIGGTDSFLYEAISSDLREWSALGSAGFVAGILGLASNGDTLVLGGESGAVQIFFPDEGFCAAAQVAAADAETFAFVGGAIAVSGGVVSRGNPASVTLLK